MHGVSEQDWVDYFDVTHQGFDRGCVESHMAECAECRGLCERLTRTVESLRTAGAEIRGGFPVEREQLFSSLASVLARYLDKRRAC